MFKISKLADYAVIVLEHLLEDQDIVRSAASVSSHTHLPEPTVAKILKLLSAGGLLVSLRGAQGGYKAKRPAEMISVLEVVIAIDGPVRITACADGDVDGCDYAGCCPLNGRWTQVNDAMKSALENVTLADMITPKDKKIAPRNYIEERV